MLSFYWFTSIKSQITVSKIANSKFKSLISIKLELQSKIHRPNLLKITQATHFSTKIPKSKQSSSENWLLKTYYALFQLFISALKSLISFKMRKKIHNQTQQTLPYPFLQKKLWNSTIFLSSKKSAGNASFSKKLSTFFENFKMPSRTQFLS